MKSKKAKEAIERYRMTFSANPKQAEETREICRLFREIVEIAEQEMEESYTCWINPKDTIPQTKEKVLVKCSDGEILFDHYLAGLDCFHVEIYSNTKVIGWRRIEY